MADKKVTVATATPTKKTINKTIASSLPLFEKDNYRWMMIGGVVIAIGMLVMAGGKNDNPDQFDYNKVYSFTRITLAPLLILIGLGIEIFAIFKRPKHA